MTLHVVRRVDARVFGISRAARSAPGLSNVTVVVALPVRDADHARIELRDAGPAPLHPAHSERLVQRQLLGFGRRALDARRPARRDPLAASGLPSSATETVSVSGLPTSAVCGGGASTTRGASFGGSSKSTAVRLPRLAEIVC